MNDGPSTEVRRLFRLTLRPQHDVKAALSSGGSSRSAPHFPHLIESILFSRKFLPTYLIVLLTAVLTWSLGRWLIRTARGRKSKAPGVSAFTSSTASSSSSTLQGTASPPLKSYGVSETTQLLEDTQLRGPIVRSGCRRAWHLVRSFLLRQPKPVPSLTSPRNTLPANETSIVILLFLALNLFYLLYRMPLSAEYIFGLADRAGLVFVVNLPVLYILAAKNNQPLGWITGWSYEGLNIFHRRLGEWMTVAAMIHGVGMVIGFYQLLAPFGYSLGWYLTRKIIIFGVIAFFSYMGIYLTSLGKFRQALYELFLGVHIFLQVLALVMLFLHHHDARPYVAAALTIWTLDRGVSRILCKTQTLIATLEVAADKETILMYCEVPLSHSRLWQFGIKSGWHAGQHVFLTVPGMGFKYRFQAHPFTIPSPPPPTGLRGGSWPLQLTIRAQDGFSRDLLEYAKYHQHTRVSIEGPHSSSEVLKAVTESDRVCLIAGGSGIAVTYPFAWSREAPMVGEEDIIHDRSRYLHGRKVGKPQIVKSSDTLDPYRFAHFWIRQESSHEAWVTMLPSVTSNSLADSERQQGIDLITHRFDTRNGHGAERPDIKTELKTWVRGDLKDMTDPQHRTCVVVSGPDGLVRDVQNTVAALVGEGWNIEVHVEKFGW